LTDSAHQSVTGNQAKALEIVAGWDYRADSGSTGAAIFQAFWRHLLQNTFTDDLPEDYWSEGGSRWNEVMRDLAADSPWWDDRATEKVIETRSDILQKSFADAVAELQQGYGKDPSAWTWGKMHAATFRNQTLGESGIGLIEDLFNRGPFETGGGDSIVNATGWSVTEGYETDWLPSMRMIVDLSNLSNSVTVNTTGQSGHAGNPHYSDMSALWASGILPMLWDLSSRAQPSPLIQTINYLAACPLMKGALLARERFFVGITPVLKLLHISRGNVE